MYRSYPIACVSWVFLFILFSEGFYGYEFMQQLILGLPNKHLPNSLL